MLRAEKLLLSSIRKDMKKYILLQLSYKYRNAKTPRKQPAEPVRMLPFFKKANSSIETNCVYEYRVDLLFSKLVTDINLPDLVQPNQEKQKEWS